MSFGKKSSSQKQEDNVAKVTPAEPAPVENMEARLARRERAEDNPSPQLLSANSPDDGDMRRRRAALLGSRGSMSTY